MRTLLASIVLAGLLAGCTAQPASGSPGSTGVASANADSVSFDAVTLSRTPCFGKCPVYSVTVHADGRVEYDGDRWVAVTGKRTAQADSKALNKLADMLAQKRMPLIADYRPGKPACEGPVATDMPGAAITIVRGKSRRTLYYYKGCQNIPDWLPTLAAQIDRAAMSGRWTGKGTEILRAPPRRPE